jgi:hypothetical protein
MKKSSRHSKITGDFAEALVLYWLSKSGYECARVDHTGIDLLAFSKDRSEQMGISVKCRSRYEGTEKESVGLPADGFRKASDACTTFGCKPFYAIVVDGANSIYCFLAPISEVETLTTDGVGGRRYWQMSDKFLKRYCENPNIQWFELQHTRCFWRDAKNEPSSIADS